MRSVSILVLALAAAACSTSREVPPSSNVVAWSATAGAATPAPDGGSDVPVSLSSTVDGGWKLYSLTQGSGGPVAMSVKAPEGAAYSIVGDVKGPAPDKAMDPNFGIQSETYSGTSGFNLTVRLPKGMDAAAPIELKVRSQACSDKLCLPARTVTVQVRKAA